MISLQFAVFVVEEGWKVMLGRGRSALSIISISIMSTMLASTGEVKSLLRIMIIVQRVATIIGSLIVPGTATEATVPVVVKIMIVVIIIW